MTDEKDSKRNYTLSEKARQQSAEAAKTHGVYSYRDSGDLPARLDQDFDRALAKELLEHAGGDPAYRLLAQSAARRATMIELAYSWLGAEDIKVMWAEDKDGRKVVKMQPILRAIGSWHEGLRRDLAELGLTPQSRAKLGLPTEPGAVDYEKLLEKQRQERKAAQERAAECGTEETSGDD